MKTLHGWSAVITDRPWLGLLVLGLLLGFAFQGSRGLWSTDEGRYTDGALQMIASGDYLVPTYSPDRINLSKPPMTYWIIAGAVTAFGHNTWAVRTPYALAFVATILLLYAMGRTLVPDKPWLPGLIYACSLVPFAATNVVSTDVLLTLFEAVAALGFVRLAFGDRRRRDAVLMWLGLGLAFLTKGPPGLILLLAAIPFIIARDGWRGLGRLFEPIGIVVFLVVGLLWYGVVVLHDPAALHYFLDREIYQRIFTPTLRRSPGPFGWAVVYLPILILGTLPWWPLLLRRWRRPLATKAPGRWLRRRPIPAFLLLWWLLPLLVFCLAQSRLPLYILPLFLPMSLLLALALDYAVHLGTPRQWVLLGLWLVALLVLKGGFAYFAHPAHDDRLAAKQLAAMTAPGTYDALVFVEDTAQAYAIEEHTPWGLNLYFDKPIYGVAWAAPDATARLCRAVHSHHATLLLVYAATIRSAAHALASHCRVRSITRVGSWRQYVLEQVAS